MSLHTFHLLPTPKPRPELRIHNHAPDPGMDTECEVVEAHRWLGAQRVSCSILGSDDGRVQEDACADGVAAEADDVE